MLTLKWNNPPSSFGTVHCHNLGISIRELEVGQPVLEGLESWA